MELTEKEKGLIKDEIAWLDNFPGVTSAQLNRILARKDHLMKMINVPVIILKERTMFPLPCGHLIPMPDKFAVGRLSCLICEISWEVRKETPTSGFNTTKTTKAETNGKVAS